VRDRRERRRSHCQVEERKARSDPDGRRHAGNERFSGHAAITKDEATKHIPVIVCTSKNAETDKIWGMRQGAKDYLVKPIDPKELLAKIAAFK